MNYRQRRAIETKKLFENFAPDVRHARAPDVILTVRDLAAAGLYSNEIATLVGKSPKAVQKVFRRYDFPVLHNFAPPVLSERPNWSGGTKLMKGYLYRRVPGHPRGTKHGSYVADHRLVVERKIGRYLTSVEVVDHLDGDITNNRPQNLRVFANNAEHLRETLKGRCPNWGEEGKKALQVARSQPRRTWRGVAIPCSRVGSKNGVDR